MSEAGKREAGLNPMARRVRSPASERPGSPQRALAGVRNTGAVFAPLWVAAILLGKPASSDNNSDLTWAALGTVFYILGLVVVLPIFAFTLGRWLDRKTWRDTRRAAVRFGIYGGGFGLLAILIYGIGGGPTLLGIVMWVAVPAVAAGAGRLLLDVRNKAWLAVSWVVFLVALLPVAYVIVAKL